MNLLRGFTVSKFNLFLLLIILPTISLSAEGSSHIRFSHFSPDAGPVDIFIDSYLFAENVSFGVISDWVQIPEGVYLISVTDSEDSPLTNYMLDLTHNSSSEWKTLSITGILERSGVFFNVIHEDYSELLLGEGRLTFVHAVAGLPNVDLELNDNILFQLVGFPDGSDIETANGYIIADVVANTYTLEIFENNHSSGVLIEESLDILPGRNYFVALIGTSEFIQLAVNSTPVTDNVLYQIIDFNQTENDPSTGFIRVAHFASGAPDITISFNGDVYFESPLSFTAVTDFIELPAGDISILAELRDTSNLSLNITLSADEWLTVTVIGTAENDTLALYAVLEDFGALNQREVRLSMFHALPGQGAVNLQLSDGTVLLSLLAFPGSQGDNDGLATIDLPEGMYSLQVVTSEDQDLVFNLGDVTLVGENHFYLALLQANPPFVFTYAPIQISN